MYAVALAKPLGGIEQYSTTPAIFGNNCFESLLSQPRSPGSQTAAVTAVYVFIYRTGQAVRAVGGKSAAIPRWYPLTVMLHHMGRCRSRSKIWYPEFIERSWPAFSTSFLCQDLLCFCRNLLYFLIIKRSKWIESCENRSFSHFIGNEKKSMSYNLIYFMKMCKISPTTSSAIANFFNFLP